MQDGELLPQGKILRDETKAAGGHAAQKGHDQGNRIHAAIVEEDERHRQENRTVQGPNPASELALHRLPIWPFFAREVLTQKLRTAHAGRHDPAVNSRRAKKVRRVLHSGARAGLELALFRSDAHQSN